MGLTDNQPAKQEIVFRILGNRGESEANTKQEQRTRKGAGKKNNACAHTIVKAASAFKYELGYLVTLLHVVLKCLSRRNTIAYSYSLITCKDLNQQQIDSCYNCTVNLTGNTVANRTSLLPEVLRLFRNAPLWNSLPA